MNISVAGLGKLGSPLAAVLASKGYNVIGIDLNAEFVDKINRGIAPIEEPQLQELITKHKDRLRATLSYEDAILHSDVTFVIVPTPSDETGLFSNKYLLSSLQTIGKVLSQKQTYHLVVITSTVTPGSTAGELQQTLETYSKRSVGDLLGLCYNPEFIALGTVVQNMLFPDMILLGQSDDRAGDMLESIYRSVCVNHPPIRRMNLINAEITKLAVNTYVTTKISYANMIADICDQLPGADACIVTQSVGLDSRIGKKNLIPAIGYGGPCFPRDNIALATLAENLGANADLAIATQKTNIHQNTRLLQYVEKYSPSMKVGILGLAYKSGTYVVEESQGIALANLLTEKGYSVSVYDPMAGKEAIPHLPSQIKNTSSIKSCIQNCDTLIIIIPWPEFKKQLQSEDLQSHIVKKTIIDCWRILDRSKFADICNLIYIGCGSNHTLQSLNIV